MNFDNHIPRANIPVTFEGSPLHSPREPGGIWTRWKTGDQAHSKIDKLASSIGQMQRQIMALQIPQNSLSNLHPFKLYNLPSQLRIFTNDDDWRRLKVRFGFLGSSGADNGSNFSIPAGCDLFPAAEDVLNIDPTQEVYLTTEIPPPNSASFVDPSWHEFVVPDDGEKYYFWATVSLFQFDSETFPTGILVGKDNTDCYSMQSGTDHLDDLWPTFPQNDPYHFLIGTAQTNNGQLILSQFQFDTIDYNRGARNTGQTSGNTSMAFRYEYSSIKYYFAGDMVTVTDTDNNVLKTYIMFPANIGDSGPPYSPEFGPIIDIEPGGSNSPDPWVLLSQSPIDESVEFAAAAFDASKKYLREI